MDESRSNPEQPQSPSVLALFVWPGLFLLFSGLAWGSPLVVGLGLAAPVVGLAASLLWD